ncbi:MAG TPA: DUF5715 family protein [Bacteroidales bacterium]|nr:DUF5715 family protein [Bacteroidales bacterium]
MPKRIRIKPLGWLLLSVVALFTAFIIAVTVSPRDKPQGFRYFIHKSFGKNCVPYRQPVYSRRLRDMLPDYIAHSSVAGIDKCADEKELRKKILKRELRKVRGGRGYETEDLSYSYPYLTREGKALVKEIGRRFRKEISKTGLRGSDFRITSMTRTGEVLKKLRRSNTNASENSPHFHGNAFDISYVRFTAKKWYITECDKYYLKEALAEVIWKLREEKKCWATYEINQGCFHVVARY